MGVDYYNCSSCNDIFGDCDTYENCESCGQMLCRKCMAKFGITKSMLNPFEIEDEDEWDACPFCSNKIISDEDAFRWALVKLNLTEEEAKKMIQRERK